MKVPSPICQLVLVLSAIVFAPPATANQCGDESPLFGQLGEQYYELDNIPKSESQKLSIQPNNLIDTLKSTSFDNGHGTRTLCLGSSMLREESREFVLESIAAVSINSFNEMVLKAYEYESDTRASRPETVFIPLSRTYISLNGSDSIAANTRHRQALRQSNGTHLREISTTATSSATGVEINQSVYINGHLAGWVTWFLNS